MKKQKLGKSTIKMMDKADLKKIRGGDAGNNSIVMTNAITFTVNTIPTNNHEREIENDI